MFSHCRNGSLTARILLLASLSSAYLWNNDVIAANSYTLSPDQSSSPSSLMMSSSSSLSIRLVDEVTEVDSLSTLLIDRPASAFIEGLTWVQQQQQQLELEKGGANKKTTITNTSILLRYTTWVDGQVVANGTVPAVHNGDALALPPSTIFVGTVAATSSGRTAIRVVLLEENQNNGQGGPSSTVETVVRSHRSWIVAVPIFLTWILFLMVKIHLEYSLLAGLFIGSWMVEGSLVNGFRAVFHTYLLDAVADPSHASLLMFVVLMTTLMALVDKSGGTTRMLQMLSNHTSKSRLAQLLVFAIGVYFFFDPYASIVMVGKILGPLLEGFPVSSEKFALILDTTSIPVASIFPGSTFITAWASLLQKQLNATGETLDGMSVLLASIKFQFYPVLVLLLLLMQLSFRRDGGPMLRIENEKWKYFLEDDEPAPMPTELVENPTRSWNWLVPIAILTLCVWMSFGLMDNDSAANDLAYPLSTWMMATGVALLATQAIFFFQTKQNGTLGCCGYSRYSDQQPFLTDTFPSTSTTRSEVMEQEVVALSPTQKHVDEDFDSEESETQQGGKRFGEKPRSLVNLEQGFDCLLAGSKVCVPIVLSLVATWAMSGVYLNLGIDCIVAGWILDEGISAEALPVVAFFSTLVLSTILGSSWMAVSIMISIATVPAFEICGGNNDTFLSFLGSLVSGAVAGGHIGPFAETTILSGLVSGSGVRDHFLSQAPYASLVALVGTLVGTIPVSFGAYPELVGYCVGAIILSIFVLLVCRRVKTLQQVSDSDAITKSRFQFGQGAGSEKCDTSKQESLSFDDPQSVLKVRSLQSFKSKLRVVAEGDCDPIHELIEDGLLPSTIRESFSSRLSETTPVHQNKTSSVLQTQKRLVEATIKEGETSGDVFSPSLRKYLRTAETKLDKMIDEEESVEFDNDGSTDGSHTDDSLDNLMLNIASKGWSAVRGLASKASEAEYTTDGDGTSTIDDSYTATSFSVGNGPSTAYTGVTSYTEDDDAESDDESSGSHSQMHSVTSSRLKRAVELNRSSDVSSSWVDRVISSADDSTVEASKASF